MSDSVERAIMISVSACTITGSGSLPERSNSDKLTDFTVTVKDSAETIKFKVAGFQPLNVLFRSLQDNDAKYHDFVREFSRSGKAELKDLALTENALTELRELASKE